MSDIKDAIQLAAEEKLRREQYNREALKLKAKIVAARYGSGGITVDPEPPPGGGWSGILTIPETQGHNARGSYYSPAFTSRDEHPTDRINAKNTTGVKQGGSRVQVSRVPVDSNGFASSAPKAPAAPARPPISPEDLFR